MLCSLRTPVSIQTRRIAHLNARNMSGKVIGKLYQYEGHSRMNRLKAVAQLSGVELEVVPGFSPMKAMTDPEYEAMFPLVEIPGFASADGTTFLNEASAITDYIASSTPESGLMPTDLGEAAQVRMWLLFCEAEIISPLTVVNRAHIGSHWNDDFVKGTFDVLKRRLGRVEKAVSTREYLVANKFTLADVTLASALGHGYDKFLDKSWQEEFPNALAYYKRILADPKVKGVLGEPKLVETTPLPKSKQT